jgi:hypothetical protein
MQNLTQPQGPCEAGFFCNNGSDSPTPDGNGKGVAGECPAGYYCEKGAALAPVACAAGTYNPVKKGSSPAACLDCKPGHYCETAHLDDTTGECDAGFFCLKGAKSKRPSQTADYGPCPKGHYCPTKGLSQPKECPAGTYQPSMEKQSCLDCPQGYHCVNGSSTTTDCPKGYYCPNNTKHAYEYPCPEGRYNNQTNSVSNCKACKLCEAGYYCKGKGRPEPNGKCAPGFYCSEGSWTDKPLSSNRLNVTQCPLYDIAGQYVPFKQRPPIS